MKKLNICPLNFNMDIPEIKSWEQKFSNNPKFKSIKHFILEDNTYYGLDEVIKNNYEFFSIGEDEKKYCLSIKDGNTIAGFVLACMFNISNNNPELFLQYLVLNPNYQSHGYGPQVLTELLNNADKHFGHKPVEVHAYVNKENLPCLNMLKNFEFSFKTMTDDYVKAHKYTKTLEDERI